MKDLPEFPTELDIYLNSLLDLLRAEGYTNVSVNRGSVNHAFLYHKPRKISYENMTHTTNIGSALVIPNTELLNYFEQKQTPPQIKELLK